MKAQEIRLAARPQGWPKLTDFEFADVEVASPEDGEVLVRNKFMSLDPAMRGWMNKGSSYVPHFEVGKGLWGGAVGEVVESRSDAFSQGDHVLHNLGWRTHATLPAKSAKKVDGSTAPLSTYLGVLGMPGLTAYAGLLRIAEFVSGDTVFVSGAAGAVGSMAGQLARLRGAKRVIGSAGSAEKVRYVTEELGFDTAFNYKEAPVHEQLKAAAPDGIDVYFDNVGGDHLEAALSALNNFGRIAACGAISQYNNEKPAPGPSNLAYVVTKRLSLKGFIVIDHNDLADKFFTEVGPLVTEGKVKYSETIVEGLENAPQTFLDLLSGANTGKMLISF